MQEKKVYTQEEFDALTSAEKSKISGMRHLTDEEVEERSKVSEVMVQKLFRQYLMDLLANENMVIGHLKTDAEKESTLSIPLNNLYQNGIDWGASKEDIDAVQRAFFSIGKYIDRVTNTYQQDLQRFMFATLGENYVDAVPLKTLILTTKAFKEVRNKTVEKPVGEN